MRVIHAYLRVVCLHTQLTWTSSSITRAMGKDRAGFMGLGKRKVKLCEEPVHSRKTSRVAICLLSPG